MEDTYGASTVGQYLDITGLADGRYRLRVTADGASGGKRVRPVPGERRDEQLHLGRPADNGGYGDGAAVWAQRLTGRLKSTLLL